MASDNPSGDNTNARRSLDFQTPEMQNQTVTQPSASGTPVTTTPHTPVTTTSTPILQTRSPSVGAPHTCDYIRSNTCDKYLTYLRLLHGILVICTWNTCDLYMEYLRFVPTYLRYLPCILAIFAHGILAIRVSLVFFALYTCDFSRHTCDLYRKYA